MTVRFSLGEARVERHETLTMPNQTTHCVATFHLCIPLLVFALLALHCEEANTIAIKSKFNKLRYVTLKDDAFCEAYQEFKDNNCVAKLTDCSPIDEDQVLKMRQILCGPRFNVELQPPPHIHAPTPPPSENSTEPFLEPYPPPFFLDVPPAQPNSFPWLAAIYNPDRKYICSGALVAPKTG